MSSNHIPECFQGVVERAARKRYAQKLAKLLREAVQGGDASTVQFLLSQGAPPTATLLDLAVQQNDADKVTALLSHEKASTLFTERIRQDALVEAIRQYWPRVVEPLLRVGKIDPNFTVQEDSRDTPLHIAADTDDLVGILVDYHANPNSRNQDGDTPLHLVSYNHESARHLVCSGEILTFQITAEPHLSTWLARAEPIWLSRKWTWQTLN